MSAAPGANVLPEAPWSLDLGGGLYLRQLTLGDAPILFAVIDQNRDELRQWLPWADRMRTVASTVDHVEASLELRATGSGLLYGVWDDLELSGVIGLHAIDAINLCAQAGYWLVAAARGRGLATRSVAALLGVAFEILNLERVEIQCAVDNEASMGIPRRLGFVEEGVLRHAQRLLGGFANVRVFGLLESDYRALLARQ